MNVRKLEFRAGGSAREVPSACMEDGRGGLHRLMAMAVCVAFFSFWPPNVAFLRILRRRGA